MPFSTVNGSKIYYETLGPISGPPLVFIEGLSAQLIGWRDEFCKKFVERGMRVIRLDNRDVGMSDKFGGPEDLDGGYTLCDMAADVIGVLDTLGLESAHVVGQSLGGIIAQTMAIERSHRVRSLSLFYTIPALAGYFTDDAKSRLYANRVERCSSREAAIEAFLTQERICGSSGYRFDEEWIRTLAARSYDRCYCPEGALRQAAALRRGGDRLEALRKLELPAAVIHGRADRLLKVEGGLDIGSALRNAEVHLYPGMGHQLVQPLWDEFVSIVARTIARA
jgi:pimeloyl-ACP methyl ester carboxylesterase